MFFANNNVLKPMQERNDSRISRYFEPGADGVYRGLDTRQAAEETDDENADLLSSVIILFSKSQITTFDKEDKTKVLVVNSKLNDKLKDILNKVNEKFENLD